MASETLVVRCSCEVECRGWRGWAAHYRIKRPRLAEPIVGALKTALPFSRERTVLVEQLHEAWAATERFAAKHKGEQA